MDKILEFITRFSWKQWLTGVLLALVFALASFLLSSCGLINRSSASGSRKVEKTVIQEQEWNIPAQTKLERTTTFYKKES